MHREESREKLEMNQLNELERSVSLCTLCVLETGGDSKNGSPHFVPSFDEIVRSNFFSQSSRMNYPSNYIDLTRVDDQSGERTCLNDNQLFKDDIITPTTFNDDEEISKSLFNALASLDASNVTPTPNNQPEASQNVKNVLQRTKHDPSPISQELGIALELSKNAVEQIINDQNNLVDVQESIEVPSEISNKATEILNCNKSKDEDLQLIAKNNDKIWEKNTSLEPLRCYNSDIKDDEIPRKKPKIIIEKILHSPCKVKLPDWLTVSRKCNKRIKLDMNCPTVSNKLKLDYEDNIELKNKTTKDKTSSSNNKNEARYNPERCESPGINEKVKETKNENSNILEKRKLVTPMNLRDPPRCSPLHPKPVRMGFRRPPTLKRLQNKLVESCKILIEGAEDLRNLSLLIDELRDGFSKTLIQDPKRKTKGPKQKFVSTCTQTNISYGLPKNSSFPEIPGNDVEPSLISLKSLENEPKSLHCQASTVDCLNVPPLNVTQANDEINRESHTHSPISGEVVFDNHYNPLRPRRWPNNQYNNRKHDRKNRTRRSPHNKFPPLPVYKETEKMAKNE